MTEKAYSAPPELGAIQQRSLMIGAAFLIIGIIGGFLSGGQQFFRSYLIGFMFWLGICLGSMAILMIQHMAGGGWGVVIRRIVEAATRTLPFFMIGVIPILLGIHSLYEWSRIGVEGSHKQLFLSVPFFVIRTIFYFTVWGLFIFFLNKNSKLQDRLKDRRLVRRMQNLSGPGLVLYGLTITFASVDWLLSLEPEWFSTIYGLLIMAGEGLTAMAFVIAFAVLLSKRDDLSSVYVPHYFHDLGKLLLAFTMIWAYFSFSQLLIIWAGNLPEEIPWYVRRLQTNWKWVGLILVVFHFALPFVLLLSRNLKQHASKLLIVAVVVLLARYVDVVWLIVPEFKDRWFHFNWLDLVLPIGMGGIWFWYFLREYRSWPILPLGDPKLEEALETAHLHH
ncbi:MAG TPA: hypothetical protein VFC63_04735 [Blastocatellia bacterium]|nr:hypothetical protein [Blastocatellia bacterium]